MTMEKLKKVAKVMVSIFITVYKLVAVLLFLLMIFSPKTYTKIVYKIIDKINSVLYKFSNIIKKIISKFKGENLI